MALGKPSSLLGKAFPVWCLREGAHTAPYLCSTRKPNKLIGPPSVNFGGTVPQFVVWMLEGWTSLTSSPRKEFQQQGTFQNQTVTSVFTMKLKIKK